MTRRTAAALALFLASLPCKAQTTDAASSGTDANTSPDASSFSAELIDAIQPSQLLADPRKLLSPVDLRERTAFLEYHASDSAIRLHAVVIPPGETMPEPAQLDPLAARLAADGTPVALAIYPFGKPEQAVLQVSPEITAVVPAPELRRAMQSVTLQASAKRTPSTQFETFLTQLSIRLYWFERLLPTTAASKDPAPLIVAATPTAKEAPPPSHMQQALARILPLLPAAIAAILVTALGTTAFAIARARAVHRFPEHAHQARLGAAHAAGVGAVISFASSNQPPAQQRGEIDRVRKGL
jgi:hypothetical protein